MPAGVPPATPGLHPGPHPGPNSSSDNPEQSPPTTQVPRDGATNGGLTPKKDLPVRPQFHHGVPPNFPVFYHQPHHFIAASPPYQLAGPPAAPVGERRVRTEGGAIRSFKMPAQYNSAFHDRLHDSTDTETEAAETGSDDMDEADDTEVED